MIRSLLLLLSALTLGAAAPGDRYAVGQVWKYHTRPQDAGSLLKIQQIEDGGKLGTIYHISVVGVVIAGRKEPTDLQHSPVSRATLDISVTRLSDVKRGWPDATAGIAEWRRAEGGVFDAPLAQIIDMMERAILGQPDPRASGSDAT